MTTISPPPSRSMTAPSSMIAHSLTSASTSTSTPPSAQAPAPASPYSKPVELLASPTAQTYTYIHPAVLLALFTLRFPALVEDPISALFHDLPLLAALQALYAVICLPPAGSGSSVTDASSAVAAAGDIGGTAKTGDADTGKRVGNAVVRPSGRVHFHHRKKHAHGLRVREAASQGITTALLSLTLSTLLGTPILAVVLVLFGAPVTTHHVETVLCAAHMAVLAATSLVYVHGVDTVAWNEIWAFAHPADAVWGGVVGTGLGAWLGAVPIPLDWDRPWQAYPITIITGAYIGYALGSLVARVPPLYGKRIEFAPNPRPSSGTAPEPVSKGSEPPPRQALN